MCYNTNVSRMHGGYTNLQLYMRRSPRFLEQHTSHSLSHLISWSLQSTHTVTLITTLVTNTITLFKSSKIQHPKDAVLEIDNSATLHVTCADKHISGLKYNNIYRFRIQGYISRLYYVISPICSVSFAFSLMIVVKATSFWP